MDKDIDAMTCDELRAEIIRMLNDINNVEILEEIYRFVKKILKMERMDNQERDYGRKKTKYYRYAHEGL